MTSYSLEIPGAPVPKARPRASRRGSHVVMYTPSKSKDFEYQVRMIASQLIPAPLQGAVCIDIELQLPRPKRLCWKTRAMPQCFCDVRPDIDNYCKSILDGLNGIAFRDDAQVAELYAKKFYHAGGEYPKTNILIRSL
ncbi:MAG: RusA family crossover junction endodeoxyribonuclease [Candidatus Peribacteraceae bacterium]|nr:RusA family crossover junction endodeoxyribonuclease [Candidatus Peribacteraceae bacterium]